MLLDPWEPVAPSSQDKRPPALAELSPPLLLPPAARKLSSPLCPDTPLAEASAAAAARLPCLLWRRALHDGAQHKRGSAGEEMLLAWSPRDQLPGHPLGSEACGQHQALMQPCTPFLQIIEHGFKPCLDVCCISCGTPAWASTRRHIRAQRQRAPALGCMATGRPRAKATRRRCATSSKRLSCGPQRHWQAGYKSSRAVPMQVELPDACIPELACRRMPAREKLIHANLNLYVGSCSPRPWPLGQPLVAVKPTRNVHATANTLIKIYQLCNVNSKSMASSCISLSEDGKKYQTQGGVGGMFPGLSQYFLRISGPSGFGGHSTRSVMVPWQFSRA